jgi:glycosyltransferase involved in cell wall biosynthesis
MGFGLPVIVTDRGGPGSAADDSCGFRLPVTTPEALARDIASAISTLVTDPELARRMGGAARARAERTALWDSRIESIEAIYRSVLDGAADDRTAT